jgi:hypothetical protein
VAKIDRKADVRIAGLDQIMVQELGLGLAAAAVGLVVPVRVGTGPGARDGVTVKAVGHARLAHVLMKVLFRQMGKILFKEIRRKAEDQISVGRTQADLIAVDLTSVDPTGEGLAAVDEVLVADRAQAIVVVKVVVGKVVGKAGDRLGTARRKRVAFPRSPTVGSLIQMLDQGRVSARVAEMAAVMAWQVRA